MSAIMSYYGTTDVEYKYSSIFGVVLLVLDYVEYIFKYLLQLDENNKGAALVCYSYYILRILFILLMILLGVSNNQLMLYTVFFCISMLIVIAIINRSLFKGFKFQLKFVESFKMAYASIASNGAMFFIYSLGLGTLEGSEVFLSAYNAMAMATDTQWDILYSAIDTNTTLSVLKGKYDENHNKLMRNSVIYSVLLFISSAIILFFIGITLNIDFKVAFITLLLETCTFPFYAIKYVQQAWIECINPTKMAFFLTISVYAVRIGTMIITNCIYSLSIGLLASAVFGNTLYIIYYLYERKRYKEGVVIINES
jgi:hypothetical protein